MGMAASQARLLSLTGRLHDVEYKAQNIEAQKIALATQKDELYQDYCDALDATSIKVTFGRKDGDKEYVDANYSTLCTYNENRYKQYALRDNKTGNMIVSNEVKTNYENFRNDKYAFAWAMLGYGEESGWEGYTGMGHSVGIGEAINSDYVSDGYQYATESDLYMTECESIVYEQYAESDGTLKEKYEDILEAETTEQKKEALESFRDYLYTKYNNDIYEQMILSKQDVKEDATATTEETFNKDKFNYYVNLFSAIKEAGGCQEIDPQFESGDEGNNWLNNMVTAGLITIQVFNDTGSKNQWSDTNVATSTNENYLQNMQNEKDLKKAEAKYEHDLSIVNKKDQKFDTELSKLETERKSITTEMDSIKQVKDDNIDRTFGIFS